jgi:PHD/YefM family antitoxin component YafN of YafNO toxin-antitoxin module
MISKLAKETAEPIYITKNGEGDLVLMSMEAFELREEMHRLKVSLAVAEQQRLDGVRTYSIEEVDEMLKEMINEHVQS